MQVVTNIYPHVPVLVAELLELVSVQADDRVIDCTFGTGGHAALVAQQLGANGSFVGIDRDPHAEAFFAERITPLVPAARLLGTPFAEGLAELAQQGERASLIYFDLGVSSPQIDQPERGFSYVQDAPLDMRMDPGAELDAATILNTWSVDELTDVFRRYGEERFARSIAQSIDRERAKRRLASTGELVDLIKAAVPKPAQFAAGHPAKRVFQALRIVVNDELGQLERALPVAWDLLEQGGRLAVIAFHSLEDRIVKQCFKAWAQGCVCPPDLPVCVCGQLPAGELLTRRAVKARPAEIEDNRRASSARLRVIRKVVDSRSES